MRGRSRLFGIVTIGAIVAIILLLGYLSYTPPLLNGGGVNFPGSIYNVVAYVYYSSLAEWRKNEEDGVESRRAAARACWYRPSRIPVLLGLDQADTYGLAREYAAFGLKNEAILLFHKAFPEVVNDEETALDTISYLARLDDWEGTEEFTGRFLEIVPESAEAGYWRKIARSGGKREVNHRQENYTPEVSLNKYFENKLEFLGYSLGPAGAGTPDKIEVELYFKIWRPHRYRFQPIIKLRDKSNGDYRHRFDKIIADGQGAVIKQALTITIPSDFARGLIDLELAIWDPKTGRTVRSIPTGRQYVPITSLKFGSK